MKILHLVHSYYGFSGASRQAKNIASNIARFWPEIHQCFFSIESNGRSKTVEQESVDIFVSSSNISLRVVNFFRVIIFFRPDIVHFHGADFALLAVCKILGIKVYWKTTLFGSDDFATLILGRYGRVKKTLISMLDANNALTHQIYRQNCRYLQPHKIFVIPNGVFIPNMDSSNPKKKLAVIISAIIPRKCVYEGILFFNENLKPHGYKLLVIGPASSNIEGFSLSYFEKCRELQNEFVVFLNEIPHSGIINILKQSTFLIHLSSNEGMPNVVLEAMACCVYPILSNLNGLAEELIVSGVTGYNNDSGLKFNYLDFLAPNSKGREECMRKNSFENVCLKTISVYESLKDK